MPSKRVHHSVAVDLLVLRRVEAMQVMSLLEQRKAQAVEVVGEAGRIVGPRRRQDVVPAA